MARTTKSGAARRVGQPTESAEQAPQAEPPRRGRPRAADRDQVIIDATVELLAELGVDRLRVQDVAERAGVGLATIYRRWPTKRDLLIAAVQHHRMPELRLTGDVRKDLQHYLGQLGQELRAKRAELFPSILALGREDDDFGAAVREHGFDQVNTAFAEILAQAPNLSPAEVQRRSRLGPALLLYRALFAGEEPDAALARDIADSVLVGLDLPRTRARRS